MTLSLPLIENLKRIISVFFFCSRYLTSKSPIFSLDSFTAVFQSSSSFLFRPISSRILLGYSCGLLTTWALLSVSPIVSTPADSKDDATQPARSLRERSLCLTSLTLLLTASLKPDQSWSCPIFHAGFLFWPWGSLFFITKLSSREKNIQL